MAVEAKVNRVLENDYVQVEVKAKNVGPRYFKVHKDRADEFCASYKKNDKKMTFITNAFFIASAFLGSLIAQIFTRNLKNKALQMTIGIVGAAIGAVGSVFGSVGILEKNGKRLLEKFNAEQIFYEDKKTVADIISKKTK